VPKEFELSGVPSERAVWLKFYLSRNFLLFPCHGDRNSTRFKQPLVPNGCDAATRDPARIAAWWRWKPQALIGLRCGPVPSGSGVSVLDIDRKRADQDGLETVVALAGGVPVAPRVTTPSGGIHLYFAAGRQGFGNTAGSAGRGIGVGCDWRNAGGYVIAPGGEGLYGWDAKANLTTLPLTAPPPALLPKEPPAFAGAGSAARAPGESKRVSLGVIPAYAKAAVEGACRRIGEARAGSQYVTLNRECFGLGQLAGAGLLPARAVFNRLLKAALAMPSYDAKHPWLARDIERKALASFRDGLAKPRRPHLQREQRYG
jgi:hypothetical protein